MFSKDPKQQIFDDKDMDQIIKRESKKRKRGALKFGEPHNQPREALQRMRSIVGAYLYFTEKKVDAIFVAQVDRIGDMLENLEKALAENPRIVEREGETVDGVIQPRKVTFDKWQPLDLKKKWYEFMDEAYRNADEKAQKFMKKNIDRLNEEYKDRKMIDQKKVDGEKDKKKQEELKLEKKLREDMKREYIPNLEKAWAKAKDWPKPKWNENLNEDSA